MTLTAKQVKQKFRSEGKTLTEWAKANNFKPKKVSFVLNERTPAVRGELHAIAVALGIKPAPEQQQNQPADS